MAWQCARILMAAEECDVMVATSRAGHQALENCLEAGAAKISRRLGLASLAIPRVRIVDIPLGTDPPPEGELDRAQGRSILRLPDGSFCIAFIGRLTQGYKADLDVLLTAVARLAASGRDVRLILAGQSPNQAYIAYLNAHLGFLQLAERTLILQDFLKRSNTSLIIARAPRIWDSPRASA